MSERVIKEFAIHVPRAVQTVLSIKSNLISDTYCQAGFRSVPNHRSRKCDVDFPDSSMELIKFSPLSFYKIYMIFRICALAFLPSVHILSEESDEAGVVPFFLFSRVSLC